MEKKLDERVSQVSQEYPNSSVEVWAMDEHRVGLQPTTQRCWSPVGQRPIERVNPGYKWCYVWAWVHPASGQLEVWLSKQVNTQMHNAMLAQVAKAVGAGPNKRVILVLDGAGWHTSKSLEVPQGIELFFLPASTPELQPAEKLWSLFDEGLIGLAASEIEQVEQVLNQRSLYLFDHPDIVQGRTLFHWWPDQPLDRSN